RHHREYPLDWVLSQLKRSGFRPIAARKVPTGYKADFVNSQLDLGRPGLERLADKALSQSLIAHGEALRSRALAYIERHGPLRHGFAYVVAADPV
ncbi:MAG: class I SAM-dependent methyltransferase, partial [Alphaproteobacteria bacterium]